MSGIKLTILFFSINSVAIAGPPPSLPTDNTPTIETTKTIPKNESQESESFLQKIKSFFGFKATATKIITKKREEQNLAQDEKVEDEPIIELGDNKLPTLQEKDTSEAVELTLPSGFQGDDAKQPDKTTPIVQTQPNTTITTPQVDVKVTPDNKDLPSIEPSDSKTSIQRQYQSKATELTLPSGFQDDDAKQPDKTTPIVQTQPNTTITKALIETKSIPVDNKSLPVISQTEESTKNTVPMNITPNIGAKLIIPNNLPISRKPHIAPKIQQKSIVQKKANDDSDDQNNTPEQVKFVDDEAKVLLLPNDDIVLGVLSAQAVSDQMDISTYIHILEQYAAEANQLDRKMVVENFLANYDDNFYITPSKIELNEAFNESLGAVRKDNLFILRALLDNYAILQRKNNENDNLLHYATSFNNYSLVKFLVIRGIDVNPFNNYHETPLMIAREHDNMYIVHLLKRAQ